MRILIAGGFGFVGGRAACQLQQAGHEVILGSRSDRRAPPWVPAATVVQINWNDGSALEYICSEVDVVIQAAGMDAPHCAADPPAALEINGLCTARLAASAGKAGVKRFIYLSTAHVYASPLVGAITEETCPRNLHPYATSHLAGENAVLSASECGQCQGIVLRLTNGFGAPMHNDANCWTILINDLCRKAVETGQMILRSSGVQQRDFIAMSEICRVIEHTACGDFETPSPAVFNVCSGVSQSVIAMAKLVQHRCKLVLGFEPELKRPEAIGAEQKSAVKFEPERLAKIGITVSADCSKEIDALLAHCQASFGRKHGQVV